MCVQEPCVYLLWPPSVVIGNNSYSSYGQYLLVLIACGRYLLVLLSYDQYLLVLVSYGRYLLVIVSYG